MRSAGAQKPGWPCCRGACWVGLVWVALMAGCSVDEGPVQPWLDGAENAHGLADDAGTPDEREEARVALELAFESNPPEAMALQDSRLVRQDLAFRIAELALVDNDPEEALRWANTGLELGQADDLFTANLLVVRGQAQERLGQDDQAASSYYDALRINDVMLQRLLEDGRQEERR